MWGFSLSFMDSLVRISLVVSFIAGAIAAIAAFVSGMVGYQLADASQKEANVRIAEASTKGDEAKAEIEKAKAQIASANAAAADAMERSANLEKEAAELKAIAAWRRITPDQYDTVKKTLAGQNFVVWTSFVGRDPEATLFRSDIDKMLVDSGLTTKYYSGWDVAVGIKITNVPGSNLDALVSAFTAAGIPFDLVDPAQLNGVTTNELTIIVGSKPPPF